MSKWTLSEYGDLPRDAAGNPIPISRKARKSTGFTVAQPAITPGVGTVVCRFCGDTAAHVKIGTGAGTDDEYVPAGQDYWFCPEGNQISFIVG